jgi:hypothetical protein
LAGLEDRLDRVVAALAERRDQPAPTPQPGPDRAMLAELDLRFDELLNALAEQMDTPPSSVAPHVLDEIQARLDEVVGLLGEPPRPAVDDDTVAELRQAIEAFTASSARRAAPVAGDEGRVILERLDQLVDQVDGLRRRIAVRAKPGTGPGGLDEAILAAIASAVATQLNERTTRPRKAVTPGQPSPDRSAPR